MRPKTVMVILLIVAGPAGMTARPADEDPFRPRPAAVRTVTDTYHGVAVPDPYRWLENIGDPEVQDWVHAQGEAARAFLDRRPGRRAFEERLTALVRSASSVHSLQAAAGRFFFLKSDPGDETDKLYVRAGKREKERLLYDPAQDSHLGRRLALNYYRPSFDGRFVALGVSADGSENAVLRVMDVKSAAFIDGEVDRVVFGQAVNWSADSAYVFYTRLRLPYGGGEVQALELPLQGTIRELITDPLDRGALVRLASCTHPSAWLAYDPRSGHFRDLGWSPCGKPDLSAYEGLEAEVTGHDGTPIPLSIVMRRGLRRDGTHPAILEAYGAYGAAVTPYFDPTLLAWLERGGIWAFAHVRGGGEFGEEWHQAGLKGKKINSILDFISCAEYLVARKFTSPDRLAAVGASAGGVVIGGALARGPDLFGAAVNDAGLLDCIRREQEANAQLAMAEFGTIRTEAGFLALLAMSPYHMIKDGSPFPAILFMTALNDPRVDPWQSFKAAARFQAATVGKRPILLRLEAKGGHGVGEARSQELAKKVDLYAFLLDALTPSPRPGRLQGIYCYMPILI